MDKIAELEAALDVAYGHCADVGIMSVIMDAARAHLSTLRVTDEARKAALKTLNNLIEAFRLDSGQYQAWKPEMENIRQCLQAPAPKVVTEKEMVEIIYAQAKICGGTSRYDVENMVKRLKSFPNGVRVEGG